MLPGGRRWRAGHQGEGAQGGATGRRHTSQAPRVCSPSLRADLTASTRCSSAKDPAHHAEVQEVPDHVSGILSSNHSAVSLSTSCTLPSGRGLAGPSVEVEVMMGMCRAALLLCINAGRFGAVELSLPEALSTAFLPRGEQHLLLGLMLHGKSSSSNLSEARRMLSPPVLSRAGAQHSQLCMLTHGAETWLCASLVRGKPDERTRCQVRSSRGSFLERMDEGQQRTRLDLATVPTGRPCAGGERFRAEQPYPTCLLHLGHCSPASACQAAAGGLGRAFPSFDGGLGTGTGRCPKEGASHTAQRV